MNVGERVGRIRPFFYVCGDRASSRKATDRKTKDCSLHSLDTFGRNSFVARTAFSLPFVL